PQTVTYDSGTFTAAWTYSTSTTIFKDQLLLAVDGTLASANRITDIAGNALDGDWVNPDSFGDTNPLIDSFPSGNGTSGGDFLFRITVLRGDVNRDGIVSRPDHAQLTESYGMSSGATWEHGDMDGNGAVNLYDVLQYRNNIGTDYRTWPAGMMMAMSTAESSAAQEARRENERFLRSLVAAGGLTAAEVDELWTVLGEI
ncbi:MAG: dockerin type I domain-containing protein, partial [Pirellulales bacterium]